jgi:hypothetical protein
MAVASATVQILESRESIDQRFALLRETMAHLSQQHCKNQPRSVHPFSWVLPCRAPLPYFRASDKTGKTTLQHRMVYPPIGDTALVKPHSRTALFANFARSYSKIAAMDMPLAL